MAAPGRHGTARRVEAMGTMCMSGQPSDAPTHTSSSRMSQRGDHEKMTLAMATPWCSTVGHIHAGTRLPRRMP
jgi:hypothetical protein